jgi:cytochrome c oxidase assembly factor CtaG
MIGYFAMPGPREWLVIIALLLVLLAGAVARFFGARIVRIQHPTFTRALGCSILAPLAYVPVGLLLRSVPVLGPVLGLIVALLVDASITRAIFRTTFARGLGAAVLAWVFQGILAVLLLKLFIVGGLLPASGSGAGPAAAGPF